MDPKQDLSQPLVFIQQFNKSFDLSRLGQLVIHHSRKLKGLPFREECNPPYSRIVHSVEQCISRLLASNGPPPWTSRGGWWRALIQNEMDICLFFCFVLISVQVSRRTASLRSGSRS